MKHVIATLLVLALAGLAIASDNPKEIDLVDYSLDAPSRIVITGELTDQSPTWHRWRVPYPYELLSLDCQLPFDSDYTTEPAFDMYCFEVTDGEPVEFVVDDASFDTVIYIYCDPFDPTLPQENGVYMDDDDGDGLNSAIFAANGVTLTPGNQYWFVICAYSTTNGTYSVVTSDNVSLCGSVANEASSWSNLKSMFD